jgi:basic amino acid/polyamine antiporter, APA family
MAPTPTQSASPPPNVRPETFQRKASGLVRTAGFVDTLNYNLSFSGFALLILLVALFQGFYNGASPVLTVIIGTVICIPLAFSYGYLASTMPRSGGEYVYVSRTMGPALGMMANFNMSVWWIFYGGVPTAYLARYGLGPFFRTIGLMTGHPSMANIGNWFTTNIGQFITGSLLIIGMVALFMPGLKWFFRVQKVLVLLGFLGLVITIIVLMGKAPVDIMHSFNHYVGPVSGKADPAAFVLSSAKTAGFSLGKFSLYGTILLLTWFAFMNANMAGAAYIGSEVKDARRTFILTIPGTLIIAGIVGVIGFAVVEKACGKEFLGALAYIDPTSIGLSSQPTVGELASFAVGNIVPAFLILLGWIWWSFSWAPMQILNTSRNFLAYSLDGLIPAWFRQVHPRFHTPVNTMVFIGCAMIGAQAVYVFTDWFSTLSGMFGLILTWTIVSVAAAILPYRLPDVFETSAVNHRIGGVPVITIVGILSTIAMLFLLWVFIKDPNSGMTPKMIVINFVILFSGLVIYYVARWTQRRKGVDVSLSFKEVPVE